jgi:hypothetical protein
MDKEPQWMMMGSLQRYNSESSRGNILKGNPNKRKSMVRSECAKITAEKNEAYQQMRQKHRVRNAVL